MRVTRSPARKARKKRVLEHAKGFRGRKKNCYGLAIDMVVRKLNYQYRDRKKKKSQMKSLWIMRINAATREQGLSYSKFIYHLNRSEKYSTLNRKTLSELAIRNPEHMKQIVSDLVAQNNNEVL